jgi:hypothetical protein
MRFIVRARREISSFPARCGTRRCNCRLEIASTSVRIDSTGARARPTTSHVTTPTTSRSSGMPAASRPLVATIDSVTVSRPIPTITVTGPLEPMAEVATTRNGSFSIGP